MTALIRATCPTCGDVELSVDQVHVRECNVSSWSYLEFACTECWDTVQRAASPEVVSVLRDAGAMVTAWSVPTEVLEVHAGPALTYDDLLDLHEALQGTDLLAPLADAAAGESLYQADAI